VTTESTVAVMFVPVSEAIQVNVTNAIRPKTCTCVSPAGMVAVTVSWRASA
jgi:hypothetical protein